MEKEFLKIGIQFFGDNEEEDDEDDVEDLDNEEDDETEDEDESDDEDLDNDSEDDEENDKDEEEDESEGENEEDKSSDDKDDKTPKTTDKKLKQSKAKNNFFKNQRLAEKEIEKAKEKAKIEGMLEAINHTNPYTNEPIKDDADIEEYLTMREMESKGLSPKDDYQKYLKDKRREEISNSKNRQSQEEFIQNDAVSFQKKYPDVNIKDLMGDEDFVDFSEKQLGKVPLIDIYESYQRIKSKYDQRVDNAVKEKTKKIKARMQSSPKGIDSSKSSEKKNNFDVDNMSDEEFEALMTRVKRGGVKLSK